MSAEEGGNLLWRFSTAWYGSVRYGTAQFGCAAALLDLLTIHAACSVK